MKARLGSQLGMYLVLGVLPLTTAFAQNSQQFKSRASQSHSHHRVVPSNPHAARHGSPEPPPRDMYGQPWQPPRDMYGNPPTRPGRYVAPSPAYVPPRAAVSGWFDVRRREAARRYYRNRDWRNGCPPGLMLRAGRCISYGVRRHWMIGRPLAGDVTYYPVPAEVVLSMGSPPPGYQYVRVAGDILLIAVGTNLVVDAVSDLFD